MQFSLQWAKKSTHKPTLQIDLPITMTTSNTQNVVLIDPYARHIARASMVPQGSHKRTRAHTRARKHTHIHRHTWHDCVCTRTMHTYTHTPCAYVCVCVCVCGACRAMCVVNPLHSNGMIHFSECGDKSRLALEPGALVSLQESPRLVCYLNPPRK